MKKLLLLCLLSTFLVAHAQTHWTPVTGFQNTMSVTGVITIDGVEQTSTDLEIGAFCGDECRGAKKAGFFPPTSQYTVPISIAGNTGDLITFRIYDHAQGAELELESVNTLTFQIDAIIGTIGDWFPFSFVTPAFHFTTAGDWSNASIWGGTLPDANSNVVVDANCTLNQDATVASLTVSDGAVLTLQAGKTLTVTGELVNTAATGLVIQDGAQLVNASANVGATVEKDVVAYGASNPDGWYTFASPVDGMPIAGSTFLTPEYDLFRYNETTIGGEWENYKYNGNVGFDTFENGRGYLYANTNTFSPTFVGTLNNAAVTYGVTYTDRPDGLEGLNLIGNPFPHAIYKGVGGAIDNANLASGYYTLANDGAWQVHNYADAIMPGQGILVKTTANANLTIAKSNAVATSETGGAKEEAGYLRISVADNNQADRAFVYFCHGFGLEKMENFNDQIPSLWIRDNGVDYAIAHIDNEYESLEVCFGNKRNADFRLTVDVKNAEFGYLQLVDNVTGATVDLLEQPDYFFHTTGSESESRFRLIFRVTTGVEEMKETPFAFVNDGNIVVNGTGTLQVLDVTGRMISSNSVSNHISIEGMAAGVYVLRLVNNENMKTQKIIIK